MDVVVVAGGALVLLEPPGESDVIGSSCVVGEPELRGAPRPDPAPLSNTCRHRNRVFIGQFAPRRRCTSSIGFG